MRAVRWLFFQGLGAVSWLAFRSLRRQVLGLYGKRGIAPASRLLTAVRAATSGRERYALLPSLLWLGSSDRALVRLCQAGEGSAALLMLGVAPRLATTAVWLLYLSLVSIGDDFLGYQWDVLLLETCLSALVAAPPGLRRRHREEEPSFLATLLMRWLLFRVVFGSGLCKLQSRDPSWRRCRACVYHYETQPLPTPLGWYAHHLPLRAQQLSTLLTLVIECGAPLLIFTPRRPRQVAFGLLTGLQLLIAATGNYGFFNPLTALLGLWLLDDAALPRFARAAALPPPRRAPWWRRALVAAASLPLLGASGTLLFARLRHRRGLPPALVELYQRVAPFRSLNSYGLFAVMTTRRPEIVIEGSNDGALWRAYEFRDKPGALDHRPRFVAPHQPRLDWQMWFAALGPPPIWFERFLGRLLLGSPEVLALLASNPFPERPPRFIRAQLYDYEMTDLETRRRTGRWWRRARLGLYFPASALSVAPRAATLET